MLKIHWIRDSLVLGLLAAVTVAHASGWGDYRAEWPGHRKVEILRFSREGGDYALLLSKEPASEYQASIYKIQSAYDGMLAWHTVFLDSGKIVSDPKPLYYTRDSMALDGKEKVVFSIQFEATHYGQQNGCWGYSADFLEAAELSSASWRVLENHEVPNSYNDLPLFPSLKGDFEVKTTLIIGRSSTLSGRENDHRLISVFLPSLKEKKSGGKYPCLSPATFDAYNIE